MVIQYYKCVWQVSNAPKDGFLLNPLKTLLRSVHRVLLDLEKFILSSGAIKIFISLPSVLGFEITSVQYYFPEIFGRILKYYESNTFLDSSPCRIFDDENCWFSFSTKNNLPCKGSEMRKIKLQKIVGNLLDKLRNLYANGTVIQKFLAFLKLYKISRQFLFLRTDILQKTVVGCP